jgi:hypothetical protein
MRACTVCARDLEADGPYVHCTRGDCPQSGGRITFREPPKHIGGWQIGNSPGAIVFWITKRPRWLTKVMCAWLLEWQWKDGTP